MNKLLFGSALGMMAGIGLMMSPAARTIRKDMNMGMRKARKMIRTLEKR